VRDPFSGLAIAVALVHASMAIFFTARPASVMSTCSWAAAGGAAICLFPSIYTRTVGFGTIGVAMAIAAGRVRLVGPDAVFDEPSAEDMWRWVCIVHLYLVYMTQLYAIAALFFQSFFAKR